MNKEKYFPRFAWGVLFFNVVVILWGAFVRATGSGAGCGSHWPLCNGEVVPRAPQVETLIEFTHRLSSGLALLLVVGLFVLAWRTFPKRHPVRLSASFSLLFIITEALVGAALVLFAWVAHNASLGRVISIAVHLTNTFLLLASLTLTAWWSKGEFPLKLRDFKGKTWILVVSLIGVLVIGITGAITALGDTLFPSSSLVEGIQQDFSGTAHALIRLRIWHPIIAILVACLVGFIALREWKLSKNAWVKRFSALLGGFFTLQLSAGLINVFLLAPVWMQIIHLLLADSVWITLILLTTSVIKEQNEIT